MKFSIITCTYNSIKFIDRNINSVSNQAFADYEHVFIDGYSTDGTAEIIKNYQTKYPDTVKFFQIEPKGISNAMNEGIKRSDGEYIIHLHSDDSLYDDSVLADVYYFLSKNNLDWIYGKINVVEETNKSVGIFPLKKIYQNSNKSIFGNKLLNYYNYIPHQGVFIKKDVFNKLGYFDEKLKSAMDSDLWFRVKGKTNWLFFDRIVSNYCIHFGSESSNIQNRQRTIQNKKIVRSRYLNKFQLVVADFIDWVLEKKNSNYR